MIAGAALGWLLAIVAGALWLSGRRRLARMRHRIARAEHELRGPLTAVALGLDAGLDAGAMAPHRLRAIRAELDRLTLALADLSAARAGRSGSSVRGPVDLAEVISDSVEAWRPAAAAAGVELELRWRGGRAPVIGDGVRIAQATGNLIANAIEHGGERVRVSVGCDGGEGRVQVSDDGPGLPARILATGRGLQASSARGHGLAIAAGVAVAHGGALRAVPAPARTGEKPELPGASLVLVLPAARRR